jgi:hypothetical protein
MFISRNIITSYANTLAFCTVASIIFTAVGAGFAFLALLRYKKHAEDMLFKRFLMFGGFALITAAMLLYIRVYTFRAFSVLYTAIPIVAFLYMIYNVYQKDFFYQTVIVGCSAGVLYAFSRWLHHTPWAAIVHVTYILAIAFIVAAIITLVVAKRRKGVMFSKRLLPHNANYNIMLLTFAIMLLSIIAVLWFGSVIAIWAVIGVLCYLFVLAVYYTIKLM